MHPFDPFSVPVFSWDYHYAKGSPDFVFVDSNIADSADIPKPGRWAAMANFPDCRLEDMDILTGSVSLDYDSVVWDRIGVDSDSASFEFFLGFFL